MDAANYLSTLGWFQDTAFDFLYILAAWETADHYYLPSGQEVWSADVSGSGNYQQVYTLSDYNYKVSRARYNSDNSQNNIAIFMYELGLPMTSTLPIIVEARCSS